ncbi:hypothetical protein G6F43_001475 [Rhizopus delemar]|nr:hypothetical protein G6F43_001475 [Rhizopus delemar]
MSTNVVESNFIYPKFHDTHSTTTTNSNTVATSKKDTEIDNSIYQLLSIYLSTDKLLDLPPATPPKRHYDHQLPPYALKHRNWLGEANKNKPQNLLERNTLFNSRKSLIKPEMIINKTRRSKSVSFNETVTIISQDHIVSKLEINDKDCDDDEEEFVDAFEDIRVA